MTIPIIKGNDKMVIGIREKGEVVWSSFKNIFIGYNGLPCKFSFRIPENPFKKNSR